MLLFTYLQTIFGVLVRKLAIRTLRSSSRLQDIYCMDKLKHSTDVPPKTQISVKINLEEFSVPFEKGPKPSPCYIQGKEMGPIRGLPANDYNLLLVLTATAFLLKLSKSSSSCFVI